MQPVINTPFWADKSLYAMVLGPLLIILSKKIGVELNVLEICAMMASIVTFIAGNKYKTTVLNKAAIENAPEVPSTPAAAAAIVAGVK